MQEVVTMPWTIESTIKLAGSTVINAESSKRSDIDRATVTYSVEGFRSLAYGRNCKHLRDRWYLRTC